MVKEVVWLFWEVFGDRRSKNKAWEAWGKIAGLDQVLFDRILYGASMYAEYRKIILSRNGTPKMAQGWLNDRRWEDELVLSSGTSSNDAQGANMSPELLAAFERIGDADEPIRNVDQ